MREEAENTTTLAKKSLVPKMFSQKKKERCYSGNRWKPGYYFRALNPFLLFTCYSGEGWWVWLVGRRPNRNWRSTLLDVAVEVGLGLAGYYGAFFVSTRVGMEPHLILVTG